MTNDQPDEAGIWDLKLDLRPHNASYQLQAGLRVLDSFLIPVPQTVHTLHGVAVCKLHLHASTDAHQPIAIVH